MSIVTVTFNPAVDKSTSVNRLVAEHKMKTSVPDFHPGGGGVNVTRALKKLDLSATAIYFEGGDAGKFYSKMLAYEQVDAIAVKIAGTTRENLIVNELFTGRQYKFGFPGPKVSAAELDRLLEEIEKIKDIDYLVVSGSLSPGIPLTVFRRLKRIAEQKKAKMVVDTAGPALKSALESGLYLIKPSLRELASLAGKQKINTKNAVNAATQLITSHKCEVVVVSMGSAGAVLVAKDLVIQVDAPLVKSVNTVGAGDSMLAGIILSLANGEDFDAALKFGVACGSAATLKPGTELCDKAMVDKLIGASFERKYEI